MCVHPLKGYDRDLTCTTCAWYHRLSSFGTKRLQRKRFYHHWSLVARYMFMLSIFWESLPNGGWLTELNYYFSRGKYRLIWDSIKLIFVEYSAIVRYWVLRILERARTQQISSLFNYKKKVTIIECICRSFPPKTALCLRALRQNTVTVRWQPEWLLENPQRQ